MTRFALTYEFDGTPFQGLQRQKHGPTVQQAMEEALFKVTGEELTLLSSGRTDAGVHAMAMVSHVDIEKDLTPFRLMEAVNAHLRPNPIGVNHCEIVSEDWHSRFSCLGRRYLYRIACRRAPLALAKKRAWQVPANLDADAMQRAAQALVGRHDFTTFRSTICQAKDPVKTLDRLDVEQVDGLFGPEIHIHAEARSFLHHQVRSMVGCLKLVGQGTWEEARITTALEARDRQALGMNAPPHGLYFVEALYPEGQK
ncbi:tRNA pseudouridine(38-40) synthase TruA [Erythrobacter crassostreae]|uniref:tRNA pseudouridine synthase A n=1 Tax=Erythrobacter crassostreae TaxID=2828328 RepID=A0A9X1JMG7_9SPHN|nr:tRNA pseudouridine(38-40) synthase TruA [Erythrobacter crassostrea]MBV7259404.1 tRNA pseudouridine(38-40) synthase TruA [Erythrobacter crassostrea]